MTERRLWGGLMILCAALYFLPVGTFDTSHFWDWLLLAGRSVVFAYIAASIYRDRIR